MLEGWIQRRIFQLRLIGAIVAALVAGAAGSAVAQSTFTLGSPAADVRRTQGVPTVIERLTSLGVEIWTFGATIRPGPNATTALTFGAGSHQDDVVRLMGTPSGVREDRAHGTMLWRYGHSAITIGVADRRVVAWVNAGANLRVRASRLAGRAHIVVDSRISRRISGGAVEA